MHFVVGLQAARQLSTADLKLLVNAKEKADAEAADAAQQANAAPEAEAAGEALGSENVAFLRGLDFAG